MKLLTTKYTFSLIGCALFFHFFQDYFKINNTEATLLTITSSISIGMYLALDYLDKKM